LGPYDRLGKITGAAAGKKGVALDADGFGCPHKTCAIKLAASSPYTEFTGNSIRRTVTFRNAPGVRVKLTGAGK